MSSLAAIAAAQARLDHGDWPGAEILARQILMQEPTRIEAWSILARIAMLAGQVTSARRLICAVLSLAPADGWGWIALAETDRNPQAAIQAAKIDPESSVPYEVAGIIAHTSGDQASAAHAFRAAAALAPESASTWENLGKHLLVADHQAQAAPILRRAVRLDPTRHGAWVDLHEAVRRLDDLDSAWESYWQVEATAPSPLLRANAASDRLISLGRFAEAHTVAAAASLPFKQQFAPASPRQLRRPSGRPLRVGLAKRREFQGRRFAPIDLAPTASAEVTLVDLEQDDLALLDLDLIIYVHILTIVEHEILARARTKAPRTVFATWYIDNHHHYLWNELVADQTDIHFPAHRYDAAYLLDHRPGAVVPLGVIQWTREDAARHYEALTDLARDDRLQGHFGYYAIGHRRNHLTLSLARSRNDHDFRLGLAHGYHVRTPRERFAEWRRHKLSIALPLVEDLPYRVFDALLAGQIPLVPRLVHDLDTVISPADQAQLPIIRFEDYSMSAIDHAVTEAIDRFDRGGSIAAADRHDFVCRAHMFEDRLAAMIRIVWRDFSYA